MMYGTYTRHLREQARAEGEKWRAAGYKARMEGQQREPPDMIGPVAHTAWLRGYDDAAQRMEDQR